MATRVLLGSALCSALFACPAWCGHVLGPDQARLLSAWLASHPGLQPATDADCDCADDIQQVRAGYGGPWKPVPDYHPYVVTGDFNGDGQVDFAVVLVDRAKREGGFAVVIFNGPFRSLEQPPAFLKTGLNLKYYGFAYGPPRKRPYRLVLGRFEADGTVFVPKGGTYTMVEP